jgi:predicted SnoaL-like aldol condensation-catalyzing enzyme
LRLQINPKTFQTDFIKPFLEVNKNGRCAIQTEDDYVFSNQRTEDGQTGIHVRYQTKFLEPLPRFNIDLTQLEAALKCVADKELVELEITKQSISYADEKIKFKIRTIEDVMVPLFKFDHKKHADIPGFLVFDLPPKITIDIKKAMDFASTSLKFYLYSDDKKLFIHFGDKKQKHLNNVDILIKDNLDKDVEERIYNVAFMRLILSQKNLMSLKLEESGVLQASSVDGPNKVIYRTAKLKD